MRRRALEEAIGGPPFRVGGAVRIVWKARQRCAGALALRATPTHVTMCTLAGAENLAVRGLDTLHPLEERIVFWDVGRLHKTLAHAILNNAHIAPEEFEAFLANG